MLLSFSLAQQCIILPKFDNIRILKWVYLFIFCLRILKWVTSMDVNVCWQAASDIADGYVEPHPLWEYPAIPLTEDFDILQLNFTASLEGIKMLERDGTIEFCR